MKIKLKYNNNEILKAIRIVNYINNQVSLNDLRRVIEKETGIFFSDKKIEEWKYNGFNNVDFIRSHVDLIKHKWWCKIVYKFTKYCLQYDGICLNCGGKSYEVD